MPPALYSGDLSCAVACVLATVAGYALLEGLSPDMVGAVLALASVVILAMLADTMFSEAFAEGGPWVAMATAGGFAVAFLLSHGAGQARAYSEERLAHGGGAVSTWEFARTAEFWFESFQNWQSEFLAVASLASLSVALRQKGSPESKPVAAPHDQTGTG